MEYDTGDRNVDKKIKVLLADNSEHFGQPCAQVMRTHGLEVQTVQKDGKLVAEEIGHLHPDVVILDFFLPRMDAIGVMKNTASLGLAHRPQFMVMSSFDNPNLKRKSYFKYPSSQRPWLRCGSNRTGDAGRSGLLFPQAL